MKQKRYLPVVVLLLAVGGVLFIRETTVSTWNIPLFINKSSERREAANREKAQKDSSGVSSKGGFASNIEEIKILMPVIVTVFVFVISLFVILSSRYDDTNRKWAFGAIGTIVGYWLGR